MAFEPLVAALEGHFNKKLAELPPAVRKRLERDLGPHELAFWDVAPVPDRQRMAEDWDSENGPRQGDDPADEEARRAGPWTPTSPRDLKRMAGLHAKIRELERILKKRALKDSKARAKSGKSLRPGSRKLTVDDLRPIVTAIIEKNPSIKPHDLVNKVKKRISRKLDSKTVREVLREGAWIDQAKPRRPRKNKESTTVKRRFSILD